METDQFPDSLDRDTPLGMFRKRWLDVSGEYHPLAPGASVADALLDYIATSGIGSVVLAGPPLPPDLATHLKGGVEIIADFGSQIFKREEAVSLCSQADAGISGVAALLAATGTLVIASRNRGDRLTAVLPPVHLVVALDAPIFADRAEFLASADRSLSYTFITGPSRTADIEKQVVLGAHGPVRVVVWGSES